MNSAAFELALKKQRLQIAGDGLRAEFGAYAARLAPACGGADHVVAGARWLRRHPQALVAAGVALAVIRPKPAWRWTRRAFVAWQAWRKLRGVVERHLPA